MNNFDFTSDLREYRERQDFSLKKMGNKLNMSKSAYYRLETGRRKPTYEEVMEIRNALNMETQLREKPVTPPPAPLKWYQSRKMHWVYPVLISYVLLGLLGQSVIFRAAYGGEEFIREYPPEPVFIVWGAIFCVFYWYYWPPKWPFSK